MTAGAPLSSLLAPSTFSLAVPNETGCYRIAPLQCLLVAIAPFLLTSSEWVGLAGMHFVRIHLKYSLRVSHRRPGSYSGDLLIDVLCVKQIRDAQGRARLGCPTRGCREQATLYTSFGTVASQWTERWFLSMHQRENIRTNKS